MISLWGFLNHFPRIKGSGSGPILVVLKRSKDRTQSKSLRKNHKPLPDKGRGSQKLYLTAIVKIQDQYPNAMPKMQMQPD